jgi:hypothetical protein
VFYPYGVLLYNYRLIVKFFEKINWKKNMGHLIVYGLKTILNISIMEILEFLEFFDYKAKVFF